MKIEFYNYFQFCFVWEHLPINFRCSIDLSTDKLKLIKKKDNQQNYKNKIFIDESRIWNLEEPAVGPASNMKSTIRSILFGYMWYDIHVESLLNIRGSSRNLAAMGITEKNNFLREFSRQLHKTERQDSFYSLQSGNWTVLYPALSTQLIFLIIKFGVFLYQYFFTVKGQKVFLNILNTQEN